MPDDVIYTVCRIIAEDSWAHETICRTHLEMPRLWGVSVQNFEVEMKRNKEWMRKGILSGTSNVVVVRRDEEIVSFAWFFLRGILPNRVVVEKSLWTNPSHRRLGLALLVHRLGIRQASIMHVRRVLVETHLNNAAMRSFIEGEGFSCIRKTRDDLLQYEKELHNLV